VSRHVGALHLIPSISWHAAVRNQMEVRVARDKENNGSAGNNGDRSGMVGEVKDLVDLMRDYAKQETVGPLKGAGQFLAYGVAGSVVMSIGVVMLILAGLRALQTQTGTALTGNLSWIPYFVMLLISAAVVGLSAFAVVRNSGGDS